MSNNNIIMPSILYTAAIICLFYLAIGSITGGLPAMSIIFIVTSFLVCFAAFVWYISNQQKKTITALNNEHKKALSQMSLQHEEDLVKLLDDTIGDVILKEITPNILTRILSSASSRKDGKPLEFLREIILNPSHPNGEETETKIVKLNEKEKKE